jgi:hypothetical protein
MKDEERKRIASPEGLAAIGFPRNGPLVAACCARNKFILVPAAIAVHARLATARQVP